MFRVGKLLFFSIFIFSYLFSQQKVDFRTEEEQLKAEKAALSTAKYLWNFLSGMAAKHNLQQAA